MNAPVPVFLRGFLSSRRLPLGLLAAALVVAGCGDESGAPGSDAAVTDGSVSMDGGMTHDSSVEADGASEQDGGITSDGSLTDSGTIDANTPTDNGPQDLGTTPQDQGTSNGAELSDILDAATWAEMFPNRNSLYTYAALIAAAEYYPAFGTTGTLAERRRELAAFLGNIAHETTGGWPTAPGGAQAWGLYFIQEVGCESGGCTGYCQASAEYPCASGQTYHGRGPIQLSWNYNYGQVGQVLGLDLLNNPSLVTSNGTVAFRTALWFWMTPQSPKPSAHAVMTGGWTPSAADTAAGRTPGFGMTVNIINGGLECDRPTDHRVEDRVAYFQRFAGMLDTTVGSNLYCDQMDHY